MSTSLRVLLISGLAVLQGADHLAQAETSSQTPAAASRVAAPAAAAFPGMPSLEERQRLQKLSNEDHADMMAQLGIKSLRPGFNGSTAPGTPNQAN